MHNYKYERDRPDLNAVIYCKTTEAAAAPMLRLDAIIDTSTSSVRSLYETLNATEAYPFWFNGENTLSLSG